MMSGGSFGMAAVPATRNPLDRYAFHLVIPSLPGYGFSGPTIERGWELRRIAPARATLMARLGYMVDPSTGSRRAGRPRRLLLEAGDGVLRDGEILYVVQNRLRILAVIRLNVDGTSGVVAARVELRDPFNVPTTVAKYSNARSVTAAACRMRSSARSSRSSRRRGGGCGRPKCGQGWRAATIPPQRWGHRSVVR
jgi:hypothetical protein